LWLNIEVEGDDKAKSTFHVLDEKEGLDSGERVWARQPELLAWIKKESVRDSIL